LPPNGSADTDRVQVVLPATVAIPGAPPSRSEEGGGKSTGIPGFRLGRTPVTNREYAPFLEWSGGEAPPWWRHPDFCSPLAPVVGVTWSDAVAFCEWLSRIAGGRWRLPSEAEWSLAACGGLLAPRTAWGDAIPAGEIPEGPLDGPWETGRGTPNGYGLYDVGTIVHEWCTDWLQPDPPPPAPRRRASRGGSWRHRVRWSSPTARSSLPPEYRYSDFGFRVLRELAPEAWPDEAGR
jgi:sulfatase modifying factor 1